MMEIEGAIDLHCHSAPDVYDRSVDDIELVEAAAAAGMGGILLKSHHTLTADRASIASRAASGGLRVFGGLVLNRTVGGLNPVAVETAMELGASQVWMPTIHAAHCMATARVDFIQDEVRRGRSGISAVGEDGRLTAAAAEVLEVVRDSDVILGTGHLGPAESLTLLRTAHDMGLRRLLVTHPLMSFTRFSTDQMRTAVEYGARLELCRLSCLPRWDDPIPPGRVAQVVREVGPERCVLSSDGGQAWNPPPPELLADFATVLWDEGVPEDDLRTMMCAVPAELLGLDGEESLAPVSTPPTS